MNIPTAKPSPRISNGVIYFYKGDTFSLNLKLKLYGENNAQYIIGSTDTIDVKFYDDTNELIASKTFSNIKDDTITIDFDSTMTEKFNRGKYYYHVVLKSTYTTTVVAKNKIIVEDSYE